MLARTLGQRVRASKKSVLQLGARQVGKSTLTRALSPDLVVNLADEAIYLGHAKDPSRLRRELSALAKPSLVVLDEIQRVPALLNTVQALMDEGTRHRFILTGSSARKLKRGGANLFDLGVRNALLGVHRHPMAPTEKGRLFEHWLVLQCLYFIRSHRLPWRAFGYRTDAGAEVDLVIDTGKSLVAVECKP